MNILLEDIAGLLDRALTPTDRGNKNMGKVIVRNMYEARARVGSHK